MLGVEMMLSNMIGMSPAQMKEASEKVMAAIASAAENMKQINARLERIEQHLGVTNNDGTHNGKLPAPGNSERISL